MTDQPQTAGDIFNVLPDEDGEFALAHLQRAMDDIDISAYGAAKWRIGKAIAVLRAVLFAPRQCSEASGDAAIADRNSLVLIRNAVVMAIAFLGRDAGTGRMETTLPQIVKTLSNADTEVRRLIDALSLSRPHQLGGDQ